MGRPKNVIVLTSGLAGSSVLAALLSRVGYWAGESTVKKIDYDTWENRELVELNKKILSEVEFNENWSMTFDKSYVPRVASRFSVLDDAAYGQFVEKCNSNAPWIWKDPRLWLTIRYWQRFLDTSNTAILLIKREPMQAWISTLIRRQIQTYRHNRRYSEGICMTILDFVRENGLDYYELTYEDLIRRPDRIITDINRLLNTALSPDDFLAVFHGKPYKNQHGFRSFLKAIAIYIRNYRERYK